MIKWFILGLVAVNLLLSGCARSKPIMTPSGKQGYRIWCEDMSYCWEEAAKKCPSGYTVVGKDKETTGYGSLTTQGGYMGIEEDGYMLIECKGANISSSNSYDDYPDKANVPQAGERTLQADRYQRALLKGWKLPEKVNPTTWLTKVYFDTNTGHYTFVNELTYPNDPWPETVKENSERGRQNALTMYRENSETRKLFKMILKRFPGITVKTYSKDGNLMSDVVLTRKDFNY